MSENLDLHNNDLAMIRYRGFDRDFISILVFALVTLNTENADEVTPKSIESAR